MYRREIDGLRAIAVVPVILFHAGVACPGGFVGVDVFFVISGYLITVAIQRELLAGKFSVVSFYERRARRILPALFAVTATTLPFAWLWLPPIELMAFAKSLVAVSWFSSNILFLRESGYFAVETELKPLLHTWSLSLEEQFYLAYPAVLLLLSRATRVGSFGVVATLATASLCLAQWGTIHFPEGNFYLLPSRGWELLAGALVALYPFRAGALPLPRIAEWGGAAGLAMIVCSVFGFSKATAWPGLMTLVPVGGTVLVLLGAHPRTIAGRILSSRALVGIGLVSYSAYLWHQPLFAFVRIRSISHPRPAHWLLLISFIFGISYLSWRFIEQPFRKKGVVTKHQILLGATCGILFFTLLGMVGYKRHGFPTRFAPQVIRAIEPTRVSTSAVCKKSGNLAANSVATKCVFGDPNAKTTVVLHGDSHAEVLLAALHPHLQAKNMKGIWITNPDCHVIPYLVAASPSSRHQHQCAASYSVVLDYMKRHADYIIALARWTYRLYPVPGEIESYLFDNGEGGKERGRATIYNSAYSNGVLDSRAPAKRKAIHHFLADLSGAANNRLILVYPVPETGWHIPRHNLVRFLNTGRIPSSVTTPHRLFLKRNAFVNNTFDEAGTTLSFTAVRPESLFCGDASAQSRCNAQVNGQPYYLDEDHLSHLGATMLAKKIADALQ